MLSPTERRWPPQPTAAERAAIGKVMTSRVWTAGPWTAEVEQRMCALTGAPFAVAFNSCTSAIHAALLAKGCSSASPVTVPSLTFAGTVTGAGHVGAQLEFVDVEHDTLTIAEAALRYFDGGIALAVDLHGVPHTLDRGRVDVITDACQSLGTTVNGQHIGATGTHAWSFSAAKIVAAPDGGAVTTDDPDTASRLRELRDYGTATDADTPRAVRPVRWRGGHNWRPSEVSMCLVAHRLEHLPYWVRRARDVAARLHAATDRLNLWRQHTTGASAPTWHKIRIGPADWSAAVARLIERRLATAGVPTHPWGYPLHKMPAYASTRDLPIAQAAAAGTFCLGTELCPPMTWTDEEIAHVERALERTAT